MTLLADFFDLPSGAIYNAGIAVAQYLDADGEMKFDFICDTETLPLSSAIGLLDMAKMQLYATKLDELAED